MMNFRILCIGISTLGLLLSCATDDAIPISDDRVSFGEPSETKDYMLFTRSGSSPNGFITGFDTFPSGELDIPNIETTLAFPAISGGVAFRNYVVNQQKLFGGAGYQRVTLNENKIPVAGSIIETFRGGSSVAFLNDSIGYYSDFNTLNIQIFNPSTFKRTGEIDMSQAFIIPENASNQYSDIIVRGNRLFSCLYTGLGFPPFAYRSDVGSIVGVVDTDSNTYIKDIFKEDSKYPGQPFLRYSSNVIDEDGTLYLATQGGLTFDSDTPTPGKIVKIPSGSDDFDPEYEFVPQDQVSTSTAITKINAGFLYVGNGIGYTNILMEEPVSGSDLVNRPLMRWAKIDLINQTAVLVERVPRNVGLTSGMAYNYRDKVQLVVYNPEENISAIYETDPSSTTAEMVFNAASGGIIYGFYELEETEK
ncbi:hypothetical protein J8281_09320 [Aquimarina sp. U1-2]|uniref:hypothetical protein n=1 Tax=Aquimarina sp. U1-2 TaxID=2823141 RepID=UPI001AECF9A0|nr:hypothetical protein [Aquimarina sp. U1-2]MBP2832384.1 hypothetical protein [Aquimarina sp. U1-2]